MAATRKTESIVAFQLEPGKDVGGSAPTDGWGDTDAIQTLGSGDALAITEFGIQGKSDVEPDNSIDGQAFSDTPNQVGKFARGPIGGNVRYRGMDKILYWAFGFERPGHSPATNCQFTVSGVSVSPAAGDTYTNNGDTYTIRGVNLSAGAGTLYTERTAGSTGPESAGDLTRTAGSGDATITFSATTDIYYSHMFELDGRDRHFAAYRSTPDEQTAGDYNAGDRKCRMATIAQKKGPNDYRYPHAMCMRFTIKSQAKAGTTWTAEAIAYEETRGNYSSSAWTFASGEVGSAYRVMHHQWVISIGAAGSLTEIGVTDFEISVDIPLQLIQTNESQLYLAEPIGEGKHNISGRLTVSRHSVDTYHTYRDSFTDIALKFVATLGNDQIKILCQDVRVKDANATDDTVANVPVEFEFGDETAAGTPFTYELEGHTILQNSPVLIITNNQNSTNEMQRE